MRSGMELCCVCVCIYLLVLLVQYLLSPHFGHRPHWCQWVPVHPGSLFLLVYLTTHTHVWAMSTLSTQRLCTLEGVSAPKGKYVKNWRSSIFTGHSVTHFTEKWSTASFPSFSRTCVCVCVIPLKPVRPGIPAGPKGPMSPFSPFDPGGPEKEERGKKIVFF